MVSPIFNKIPPSQQFYDEISSNIFLCVSRTFSSSALPLHRRKYKRRAERKFYIQKEIFQAFLKLKKTWELNSSTLISTASVSCLDSSWQPVESTSQTLESPSRSGRSSRNVSIFYLLNSYLVNTYLGQHRFLKLSIIRGLIWLI